MNTCAVTRLLFPGFIVGMIVSSVAASDLLGLLAAAVTIAALLVVQQVRGTTTACAIQLPAQPTHDESSSSEPASKITSPH